ncbi:hypothetical protein DFH28DRAFT_1200028 [Melampsora americana]|nr:hypothetical protein DFH28DRAFT_1200028 [Melampsora americana]
MPGSPYITSKYLRAPPLIPLPKPYPGVSSGLMCPECSPANDRSLIYLHSGGDTIRVMCRTVEKHFYQTFKLNQLNHEIAMINAGEKYPIPYEPSAYGPPVNIHGATVTVPQKGKKPPKETTRAPPSLKCQRVKHGSTAAKHKTAGHTGCILKYCKSCCLEFGTPGACYAHRLKPPTVPDIPDGLITPPGHHVPPSAILPKPKRPRIIQPQCAQSIRRVGRILDKEGHSVLEEARKRQEEAVRKVSNPLLDEGKEHRHPVISHLFPTWPVAIFDDCKSLLRQAKQAAGTAWDDNLIVWDEEVKNWREIGVFIPHQYTRSSRNIVISLPSQHLDLADELQGVLETFGMGKPNVARLPFDLSAIPLHNGVSLPTTRSLILRKLMIHHTDKAHLSASLMDPISFMASSDSDSESEISHKRLLRFLASSSAQQDHPTSTPDSSLHLDPALFGQGASQLDQKPLLLPYQHHNHPGSSANTTLHEWPGELALAPLLIDWYLASIKRGTRIPQWIVFFGTQFHLEEPTVYRYWKWVEKVGPQQMRTWIQGWPTEGEITPENVTISRLRRHFQREFNEVSGLKETVVRQRGMGVGKGPRRVTKRNSVSISPSKN